MWSALAPILTILISVCATSLINFTFYTAAIAVNTFQPGFVPISSCVVQDGLLNCSQITDASCDHSMDLGVVCRTYEQLYNELLNQCSSTDPPPTSPTSVETTCSTINCSICSTLTNGSIPHPTATSHPTDTVPPHSRTCLPCQTITTAAISRNEISTNKASGTEPDSTPALGGVVGVLLALLVVLVIGWSLSCVALVKRNSFTQKQTQ